MTRYRARRSRTLRWIETILLVAGLTGVGVWAWSVAGQAFYQDWGDWAFDRQMRGQSATISEYFAEKRRRIKERWAHAELPAPPAPPAPPETEPPITAPPAIPNNGAGVPDNGGIPANGLVGRLSIPRLDLHAVVREGVDEKTLRLALGHIPGTAFPGQSGNVGVAGHRDTLFRPLRRIRPNDVIWFQTPQGTHEYRVESTEVVTPKQVSVLQPHQAPELTLVTCYPFYYIGGAPDRFIVKAREVTGASPVASKPAPLQEQPEREQPKQTPAAVAESSKPAGHARGANQTAFEIRKDHSQELAPGISLGVTGTDEATHRVNGWMWVMPDRRTIWLRGQRAHDPVIFYGHEDGKKRELVITRVASSSVSGYLVLPESGRR